MGKTYLDRAGLQSISASGGCGLGAVVLRGGAELVESRIWETTHDVED